MILKIRQPLPGAEIYFDELSLTLKRLGSCSICFRVVPNGAVESLWANRSSTLSWVLHLQPGIHQQIENMRNRQCLRGSDRLPQSPYTIQARKIPQQLQKSNLRAQQNTYGRIDGGGHMARKLCKRTISGLISDWGRKGGMSSQPIDRFKSEVVFSTTLD